MLTQKMNKSRVLACVCIYSSLLSKAVAPLPTPAATWGSIPFDGGILFQVMNASELISFSWLHKQTHSKEYPGELLTKLWHNMTPSGISQTRLLSLWRIVHFTTLFFFNKSSAPSVISSQFQKHCLHIVQIVFFKINCKLSRVSVLYAHACKLQT